jgi:tRNA pseudouridine55 synthase
VTIHAIDIVRWQLIELVIDVRCSKGTYIRTLAEDIGEALGCGAHLAALRRTGSGRCDVADAITLDALAALTSRASPAAAGRRAAGRLAAVRLPDDEAGRFLTGLRRRVRWPTRRRARLRPRRAFLGSAHITAGELIADRLPSGPPTSPPAS